MLLSIDHGNRQMKSSHFVFTSGLTESDTKPPFGDDILRYNNKYYTLSEKRIPYTRRKHEDERFFILTLFAIAKEIEAAGMNPAAGLIRLTLCCGLPPAHFGAQYKAFETFFKNRGLIRFIYNNKTYSIQIENSMCFPQAVAAAMTVFGQIKQYSRCTVIDLGGYTADYVQMQKGKADFSVCDSLEHGVIILYNDIFKKVNSDLDITLSETDIDAIILNHDNDFPFQIKTIVYNMTAAFVENLVGILRERGIDLRIGKTIFIGGGSILLRKYIDTCGKIGPHIFIEDINANVKGYELMYQLHRR